MTNKEEHCNHTKEELSNVMVKDPHDAEAMNLITKAITKSKAVVLIKLLPYLPEEYQTVRALGEILGVSHATVHNCIKEY